MLVVILVDGSYCGGRDEMDGGDEQKIDIEHITSTYMILFYPVKR